MMKSSNDVLDALREALGGVSDYRVSRELNIPASQISSIRNGRRKMSRNICVDAAKILKVEPAVVLTIVAAEREDDAQIRASLLRLAEQGLAAMLLISLGIMSGLPAAEVARGVAFCILCKITDGLRFRRILPRWRDPPAPKFPL